MNKLALTKLQIETLTHEYVFDILSADNIKQINIMDDISDVFVSYTIEEKVYFAILTLNNLLAFKKELIFNRFFE